MISWRTKEGGHGRLRSSEKGREPALLLFLLREPLIGAVGRWPKKRAERERQDEIDPGCVYVHPRPCTDTRALSLSLLPPSVFVALFNALLCI